MNAPPPKNLSPLVRAARYRCQKSLSGDSGSVQGLSHAMESLARGLLRETLAQSPVAILPIIVGSVARREAAPFSDIDLWLIYNERAVASSACAERWTHFLERRLPSLWDRGVAITPGVFTPQHLAVLARKDLRTWTACFDARPLYASDQFAFGRFQTELIRELREVRGDDVSLLYRRQMNAQQIAQHSREVIFEESHARLEPDLMGDAGGLRDCLRPRCLLAKQALESGFSSLAGALDASRRSRAFLLRVRAALHLSAGRARDVLRFERQAEVAQLLSLASERELLQQVHRAMREERWHLLGRLQKIEAHAAIFFARKSHRTRLSGQARAEAPPRDLDDALLRVVEMEREKQRGTHAAAAQLRQFGKKFTSSVQGLTYSRWLSLFYEPALCRDTLLRLHHLELLPLLCPPLQKVVGLAQRDLFHTHAVDAHLVRTFLGAVALVLREDPDAPKEVVEATHALLSPHILLLSALLHDVGKGQGGGHAERGAFLTKSFLSAAGVSKSFAADVVWLIANHLKMGFLSQRRDFVDPVVGCDFAKLCQTSERLRLLYLLAYVDAAATGPLARTHYKITLLSALFRQTAAILAASPEDAPTSTLLETSMPQDRAPPVSAEPEPSPSRAVVGPGEDPHSSHIEVLTTDRDGLFLALVETLAALHLEVRRAVLAAPQEGQIHDLFVIACPLRDLPLASAAIAASLLRAAEHGTSEQHQERLRAVKRGHRGTTPSAASSIGAMQFTPNAQHTELILDLQIPDRSHLLVDIARIFVPLKIDVHRAFLWTEGRVTRDTFYLRRRGGTKTFSRRHITDLTAALGGVLATNDGPC